LHKEVFLRSDFYIPEHKFIIEINGRSHYYPYSTKYNNYMNFKTKMFRNQGFRVLHLNSWKLEGMINHNKEAVADLIGKSIKGREAQKQE
jgi:very-short-patch-repair endonuclease